MSRDKTCTGEAESPAEEGVPQIIVAADENQLVLSIADAQRKRENDRNG